MCRSVKIFAIAFGCCIGFHASATEIFRCTTSSGAVEYKDSPCAPGAGGKVAIQNDTASAADQAAANEAVRKMKEQSKAIDARINARAKADRDARQAEAREEAMAQRIAELSALAQPAEPQVVLLPVVVDPCVVRPALCAPRHHHEHQNAIQAPPTAPAGQSATAVQEKQKK